MAEVIKEALFVAIDTIKADGRTIKTSLKRARFAPKMAVPKISQEATKSYIPFPPHRPGQWLQYLGSSF